jgi:hypothetical protein
LAGAELTAAAVAYQTQVASRATQIASQTSPERLAALTSPDGRHRFGHWRTACVEVREPGSTAVLAGSEQLILIDTNGNGSSVIETQVRTARGSVVSGWLPCAGRATAVSCMSQPRL